MRQRDILLNVRRRFFHDKFFLCPEFPSLTSTPAQGAGRSKSLPSTSSKERKSSKGPERELDTCSLEFVKIRIKAIQIGGKKRWWPGKLGCRGKKHCVTINAPNGFIHER